VITTIGYIEIKGKKIKERERKKKLKRKREKKRKKKSKEKERKKEIVTAPKDIMRKHHKKWNVVQLGHCTVVLLHLAA